MSSPAARPPTAREIQLPTPVEPPAPVPAGADLRVKGLTPYVTANADFYRIDTALHVPVIDPDTWRLTVTGLVEEEITLTYAELLAKPMVEHLSTLTCKANPVGANPIAGNLVGNASWLGFPVRELLAQARPGPTPTWCCRSASTAGVREHRSAPCCRSSGRPCSPSA